MTQDTRGGVQPYAALARALVDAGHAVRAVAPADLAWLFERIGVRCLRLDGMERRRITEVALQAQGSRLGGLRQASRAIAERVPEWALRARAFADGSDILTGGVGGSVIGLPVAAALGVPWVPAHLQPVGMLNSDYPGVLVPGWPRGPGAVGNVAGQLLTEAAIRLPFQGAQRAARRALGLTARPIPKASGSVYGISPEVIRAPAHRTADRVFTGYWFDTTDSDVLAPELDDFIASSDARPVVSIGFGSMVTGDPDRLRDLVADAARAAGARVVLIAGDGAVGHRGAVTSDVLVVPSVPHRALFPRMNANVHHGGAGTTASALAAGVPTVVVPFGADQGFWARRAAELGVAPPPVPFKGLTRDRLTEALRVALTDREMSRRSAELGRRIRAENGTEAAARWYSAIRR